MKRILLYGTVLWLVLFAMAVCMARPEPSDEHLTDDEPEDVIAAAATVKTEGSTGKPSEKANETMDTPQAASYDETHTILVKMKDGIKMVRMDTYLVGVVAAEMPASFSEEALKAQAVSARTFAARREAEAASGNTKSGHDGAVICTDPGCCMAYCDLTMEAADVFGSNAKPYTEKVKKAVADTDGEILTWEDVPILAAFHAVSGGYTENAEDVWGSYVPYLVSVSSAGEENAANYRGTVTITAEAFRELMLTVYPSAELGNDPTVWFADAVRGDGGGVKTVSVGGVTVKGSVLRSLLGLNSTDFTVRVGVDDLGAVTLTFETIGYGHGVGMSQYGALAMAQRGCTYQEILRAYYTGVELEKRI